MGSSNLVRVSLIPEEVYGQTPAEVKATIVVQDLTYTASRFGRDGNKIKIIYTDTETAGSESVTVDGNIITVGIEDDESSATQVKAAIDGSPEALALVSVAITGTGSNDQLVGEFDAHAYLEVQDLTYKAVVRGDAGEDISIQYTDTEDAGEENVDVTGTAIVVGIESGVSTAAQVMAAVQASPSAMALISVSLTGTGITAQVTAAETPLAGGDGINGSGEASIVRFTSEALSGTPNTVESQQIRVDRMSSGQVVVGLAVEGDLNFELAKEDPLDLLLESAMLSEFDSVDWVEVDLVIDADAKTLSRGSGDFTDLVVGDFLTLDEFVNSENNVQILVAEIVDSNTIRYVGPTGMVDETKASAFYKRADKIGIGVTKKSFSMEKAFTDLVEKAINYRGMLVSKLDLKFAYGALATGTIGLSGNDHETVEDAEDFITFSRTVREASTAQTLNGSVDMPFLASSGIGDLDSSGFDLQSITLKLSNNLNAINAIGNIAPKNYTPGTAKIDIEMSAYMTDAVWSILAKKLTQEPFAVAFMVKNADGWYGFFMPAVQVSFPDPASGGQNQDIILNMTGTAKVGEEGESALTIYRGV